MGFLQEIKAALQGVLTVKPKPFDTGWITIAGIGTASVYTTGDVVGRAFTLSDLPKAGRFEAVQVLDEDKEEIACNIPLFDETPGVVADHDIFVVAADDYAKQVTDIAITNADYSTYSGSSFASADLLGRRFSAPNGSLIGYWVTRGAPTIAVDKVLRIRFLGYSDQEAK